ncbi:MAG: family 20 glycosylhydrolase [Mangrovibacterium sp.]
MRHLKEKLILFLVFATIFSPARSGELLPLRGFCISAPRSTELDAFIRFIDQELAPRKVNTLILRVDYNYAFESHPELRDENALTKADVKRLVAACRKDSISLIPQINLLGHQSWAGRTGNLLKVYPEFDETPHVKMPEKYEWPNADGLYCKSYCPLHPDVHKVVFELVDEICDVFEADAFHAGMDEVFYVGDDKCPRCKGSDKAELFAGEVNRIRNHLELKNRRLWIWGDRLIDGKTTGIGMWEASMNNTHRAIDLVSKDVMICDWHYERPDQTAIYFAIKGFQVATCPWRNPEVAVDQVNDMLHFRATATPEMKDRFRGIIQTVWTGVDGFLKEFYGQEETVKNTSANCFRAAFAKIVND